jgi:hypothetical protein
MWRRIPRDLPRHPQCVSLPLGTQTCLGLSESLGLKGDRRLAIVVVESVDEVAMPGGQRHGDRHAADFDRSGDDERCRGGKPISRNRAELSAGQVRNWKPVQSGRKLAGAVGDVSLSYWKDWSE